MSAQETVRLTIDGRDVEVAKGTGLVESAAAAGIEIPVFCYEPRLGPPVGACRMCLVEIEGGPPKPQAACTLTAQEGMVVKTAQTSALAADAQDATLEFILVNHPLDCPVCDKGGECPLQDLTFRYGPGNTRMSFPKRTFDKPIPISPLIALDRERCILCYRCTRFSEHVSEDGQLIARNRGAQSQIATFEDTPYRTPFSGNVIELCPVGALTSTQYRFEGRPWEIQNVPSVCGLCPVGCNVTATTREGKVKRMLSRNHPEVDGGWLCDKGRFAPPHLYAGDRVRDPLQKVGQRRFEPVPWEGALDRAAELARAAGGAVVTALSGTETVEIAYALGRLVRGGLGSSTVVLPEPTSPLLDAYRAPLSSLRSAQVIVVLGDEPVVERAPLVDLWLRDARRRGAELITVGPAGTVSRPGGSAAETAAELAQAGNEIGGKLRAADRAAVIWSGPSETGGEELARLAHAVGFAGKPGCAAFYLPSTPNGRGVAEAWNAAGDGRDGAPARIGLLIVSGDDAAADPKVRALADRAEAVIAIAMFSEPLRGWVDLVLPATSYLERDGTTVNLEGRVQRQRRAVIPPGPDELAYLADLAGRFGVALEPHAPLVFAEVSEKVYGGRTFGSVGEHAPLPDRAAAVEPAAAPAPAPSAATGGPLRLVRYRAAFAGPVIERVDELQFHRPDTTIELASSDASVRGIGTGDIVRVSSNGTSIELRAIVNRRLATGSARAAAEHVAALAGACEVTRA